MSAPSPVTSTSDLATFTLKAAGKDVSNRYQIVEIEVHRALNRIPAARIVLRDGDVADESFAACAGADFAPGAKIEILFGYHGKDTPVYSGLVVNSAIQHTGAGPSTLTVGCRDAAVAMTIGRHSACFTEMTDSAVMQSLVSNYSKLSAAITATSGTLEEITQYAATDWDFLLARAEANGLVVSVESGKVSVIKPQFSGSAVLSVTYGLDLLEFSLEEDVRTQLGSVACTAWDVAKQAVLTTTKSAPNNNPLGADTSSKLAATTGARPFQLNTPTPLATAALGVWAEAQLLKSSLAKIRGTVRFQGSAGIAPGDLLELAGLGERFDGKAYVTGVTHELRDGDWTTTATIGLDPAWFAARPDVSAPLAYAQLPGASGIHIGTVKKIDADPGKQFRVLVLAPVIDNTGKGIWARLARPYASNNAGHVFYPEVGDEVLLAFLDGDPRYPVILGSVFSSSRKPPLPLDEKNTQKGIVTSSQLKVLFDETKKSITLQTPGGHSIVMSDDAKSITLTDLNGNSAKFSTDGIVLNSVKNLTITAAQNVSIEAKAGQLTAKGTQGVTVSGLKVALSADTEFSAKGNATASLTASGQTTVKGAIVMIN